MEMNIYAKSGHKVVVTERGMRSGYEAHIATAKQHLTVGQVYTVDHTEVGDFHTDVFLKEIPGVAFNSLHFDNAR